MFMYKASVHQHVNSAGTRTSTVISFHLPSPSSTFSQLISKLEYLSNHLSDLPQILNLSLWDQTKTENCLKQCQKVQAKLRKCRHQHAARKAEL
jgi:hypothetical protein